MSTTSTTVDTRTTAPVADDIASSAADETAVRDLFRRMLDAWGRGDGDAYGDQFTEDVDYVAFDGAHTKGRQQVATWHQQLFDTWLKGTRLVGQIERIRFLSPDVALVHATGATLMPGKDRPVRSSIQTLVATKRDGAWQFTAFHNCRIVHRNALQWLLFGIATKVFGR
ncbi:MAG: SgcJ/EcaC family oxidoreductase [Chloroflexota bacterium]